MLKKVQKKYKKYIWVKKSIILFKKYSLAALIYGIRGIAYDWIKDYLKNRLQFVRINNTDSTLKELTCGVPQGSILGPLLFLIYVNDIQYASTANILSFADDTTIYTSDTDYSNLFVTANTIMAELFNWFCANKLFLNAQKLNI